MEEVVTTSLKYNRATQIEYASCTSLQFDYIKKDKKKCRKHYTCASSVQWGSSRRKGQRSFSETAIIRMPLLPRMSCFPDDILMDRNKWLRAQGPSADWFEEADTSCTWYCSFSCQINFARYGLHKPQRWWKRFYWHSLKLQISKYRLNELWCWICKRPCWYWFKLCFPSFWISTTLAASY